MVPTSFADGVPLEVLHSCTFTTSSLVVFVNAEFTQRDNKEQGGQLVMCQIEDSRQRGD